MFRVYEIIKKILFCSVVIACCPHMAFAQENATRDLASQKMQELGTLIKQAESKNISTLKERTALRTAEVFMTYADWDEKNIEKNKKQFSLVSKYKDDPLKWAQILPNFERDEIVKMMDSSIDELKAVISGKIKRLPTPDVDWCKTEIKGDEILYKGHPVFLNDWTWKPRIESYNEYFGNQDGFFLTPSFVINEQGDVSKKVINELVNKESGSMGFVFLNHTSMPTWAKDKDPKIIDGPGLRYTMYDINNPLCRRVISDLIKNTVPMMAGKQYTKLGYMLCNEPHWNCIDKTWASGPISDYAYADFIKWLQNKHKNIATLNRVWGTKYKSFKNIDCPHIMQANMQGTPMYFDFLSFNMDRVTEWFSFLSSEIKKYDKDALTHIKLMPNLWTEGKRDSGIDMEALTYNSDIIGNDASSCGNWMWGKPHHWERLYSFDWIEMCMGYDFFKSVSPNKVMYNTEGHLLSTGKYRDLYQSKEYTRLNYWMAYVNGLTAQQTWYWCRRTDGDSRDHEDSNGYAGSNNHQPRVVNEVHATIADLNSVSDYIMTMQRQKKPIRIFYTKASSINKPTHMDDIFSIYEKMYFEGIPIGFATKGIIEHNDNNSWNMIVVAKTPYVFESDMKALQDYLNNGGTVITDGESMKTDEYGQPLKTKLMQGNGKIITMSSVESVCSTALNLVEQSKDAPAIEVVETNGSNQKTCTWKLIDSEQGKKILNIANFGKVESKISLNFKDNRKIKSVTNVLTGEKVSSSFTLPVYGLMLLEIE